MRSVLVPDAAHAVRLVAEIVANRLRAGRTVDLALGPGPVRAGVEVALHDGGLLERARAGRGAGAAADLLVADAEAATGSGAAVRELLAVGEPAHPGAAPPAGAGAVTLVRVRDGASGAEALAGRVVVVLGHREPGLSAEHRASEHSRARLEHAAELVARGGVRAAVLTGWTQTGGLSEAEQMARWWTAADVPLVLEVAGRNTAENASRTLPLVLALGGVRRVTVVTSAWHLRAPYFFAPYRSYALEVDLRPSWDMRGWPHLLALELESLRFVRRARREAMVGVRILDPRAGDMH